ncbi:branched-chain amino acid transporter permease [Clostridium polyendosporum]|uniref:branched-chain amino acid transporter permease n=1 Tax=Clostridium polyendosporum TaxID=69208 RepID=UPI001BB3B890|nr:AzlD domain-containing protein [Clostridium polyendosporum]
MILSVQQSLVLVSLITLGTFLTRGMSFILFPNSKETPKYILYLGNVLPFAAIGLPIVYCLKNVSILSAPYGIPEGIAIVCVVMLHLWKYSFTVIVYLLKLSLRLSLCNCYNIKIKERNFYYVFI